jgi:hypothetical protein
VDKGEVESLLLNGSNGRSPRRYLKKRGLLAVYSLLDDRTESTPRKGKDRQCVVPSVLADGRIRRNSTTKNGYTHKQIKYTRKAPGATNLLIRD